MDPVIALFILAIGWCLRNGPYLSLREATVRDRGREATSRLREAAKAEAALAVSREQLEALRVDVYTEAEQAQAALAEAQARVEAADQTLRVVQAVREQTVAIMSKRWDEPQDAAVDAPVDEASADAVVEVVTEETEPVVEAPQPSARQRFATKPGPRKQKVTVQDAPAELVEVPV